MEGQKTAQNPTETRIQVFPQILRRLALLQVDLGFFVKSPYLFLIDKIIKDN